jgi:hypothetical protein
LPSTTAGHVKWWAGVRGGVEVDVCGAAEGNAHGDAAMAVAVAVSAGMRGAVADCGFVAAGPGLLLL